jgi:alanine racemase
MYGYNQMPSKGNGIKARLRQLRNDLKRKLLSISPTNDAALIELKPVISLYSDVIQIKNVKKKQYVGYGLKYRAKEDIVAATIPIGYADGFDLRNSGRDVIINNKRYPIIGSVNMGMISVKVDDSVKVGDKVTLIGEGIPLREVSRYINTTVYEVITTIASSVPRVYTENQKVIYTEESKW